MTVRQAFACVAIVALVSSLGLLLLRNRVRHGALTGSFFLGLSIGSFASASMIPLCTWEIYGVE